MTTSIKLLEEYVSTPATPMYLSSKFGVTERSFHDSEKVEVHIQEGGEDVAVPQTNAGDGYNKNQTGGFVGKKFSTPVFKESETFDASEVYSGQLIGTHMYSDPGFQEKVISRAMWSAEVLQSKILRAMELQAAQIFTTGAITSVNSAGATVFSESFGAKGTHFFNSSVDWDTTATAAPITDITNAANLIQNDSHLRPDEVIFGAESFDAALAVTSFNSRFKDASESWALGRISPEMVDAALNAQLVGTLWAGGHHLRLYVYNATYKNPNGGAATKYILKNQVVVRASAGRMQATFGGIPSFGVDGRANAFFSARLPSVAGRTDMYVKAYLEPNGDQMTICVAARPLLVPVAVNSFACINTQVS